MLFQLHYDRTCTGMYIILCRIAVRFLLIRQATDIQCTDERENRPGFVSAGVCSLSLFGSCSARDDSYAGVVCCK